MRFNFSIYIYYSFFLYFFSFMLFITSLYFLLVNKIFIFEWNLLSISGCEINLPLIMDKYGLLFSSVVLFISANVFMFSNYYMSGEIYTKRFLYLVILFIMSMNFLIYIPHMMGLLLGWDGLGLVSFVLVIYYQNSKSLSAGMLTALSNRVGDVFLLLSVGWTLSQGHWMILFMWDSYYSFFIVFSVMVAGMTKSAQIPFSSWLPAAMAAPTPVSALVHSSTLVTAGVFLLIRFYPFLTLMVGFNSCILIISSLTMFMAGMSALVECDMKKIIALSTLSQLGVMMSSIGLGLPDLAFFHLITHALFKALLFVCAGTLIHLHHHSQDLRNMGNLVNQMPLTMSCLNVANMALCGLPFLSGFYSKDLIIEMTLYSNYSNIILLLFIAATMMTAAYSLRLMFTGVLSMNLGFSLQYTSDNSLDNTTPMILLSLGGIFLGCFMNWFFMLPLTEPVLNYFMKISAFVVTILGGMFMYMVMFFNFSVSKNMKLVHNMSAYMWFMVPASTQMLLNLPFKAGKLNLALLDQGWVEVFGAQGMFMLLHKIFTKYQVMQYSVITSHLTLMILFFMIFSMV